MRKIRFAALLLAAVMIVGVLGGCGKKAANAITFGDVVITENEYSYMMSTYKGMYLYTFFGLTSDNAEIWKSKMTDEVTVGDYLGALAVANIMSSAIYVGLFEQYGLSLTDGEINGVDEEIAKSVNELGSTASLNKVLAVYGANVDTLRNVLLNSLKVAKLQHHLYGENGIDVATDAEIDEYYKSTYMRTKFIFVSSEKEYERDENGELIYDEEAEAYKTRDLTEEEKAAKKALMESLEGRVAAGEDFDALVKEYTMSLDMLNYEDGYYFTSASTFLENSLKTTVAEMEIGDTKSLETDTGWYIIKRLELRDGAYADEKYASVMFGDIKNTVNTLKMQKLIEPYADQLVINQDVVGNYPIEYCTPNFSSIPAQTN